MLIQTSVQRALPTCADRTICNRARFLPCGRHNIIVIEPAHHEQGTHKDLLPPRVSIKSCTRAVRDEKRNCQVVSGP